MSRLVRTSYDWSLVLGHSLSCKRTPWYFRAVFAFFVQLLALQTCWTFLWTLPKGSIEELEPQSDRFSPSTSEADTHRTLNVLVSWQRSLSETNDTHSIRMRIASTHHFYRAKSAFLYGRSCTHWLLSHQISNICRSQLVWTHWNVDPVHHGLASNIVNDNR